jgi:DUF1365 family protein
MNTMLFFGTVMHARVRPRRNSFVYRVFFLRVALHRLESLRGLLLSLDRWNLFSFNRRDHGPRDGSDLLCWIRALLAQEGIESADGDIWLQAFPRVLGYVFNPISFWFCHDRAGVLRAVLCQVSNTFGEHHNYLIAHADQSPIESGDWLSARKVFHVSPFFEVAGRYRFQFSLEDAVCVMRIDYEDANGHLLATALRGQVRPLTTRNLAIAFLLYPWMTLGVILRIHWQALRLWVKGVPVVSKPSAPVQETTR